ncbi:DUF177 domain-containing protein [Thermodesulfobacteriota bacterium]
MIINLKAIPKDGTRSIEFHLDNDWWNPDGRNDQVLGFDIPLAVKIEIYRAGDKYALEGDLAGRLQIICDRCLDVYRLDLRFDFRQILALPPPEMEKAEIELLEEDMEIGFIRGEEIDLDDIIREQLYLSLPVKSLCQEECLGLCSICGSNLNDGDCQCKKEQGHPSLSKLKSLKIEGE